ncbi:MAG TPA: hypothetical protein VGL34_18755 [Steroidobacteraceae bacterium]
MQTPLNLRTLAGRCLMCALLAAGPVLADGASPLPPHEPGIWQKHEYSFAFMGFTSTYSCDGLAGKLKILLIASGARPDAKAQPGACAAGFGRPDKFARADLTFYTLAPANADKSADNPPVDGVWLPVVIAARKPRDLSTGDCELVEQFKSNVLPMFTTRNVDGRTTCVPHQQSGSAIDLRFESFSAPPKGHRPKPRAARPTTP